MLQLFYTNHSKASSRDGQVLWLSRELEVYRKIIFTVFRNYSQLCTWCNRKILLRNTGISERHPKMKEMGSFFILFFDTSHVAQTRLKLVLNFWSRCLGYRKRNFLYFFSSYIQLLVSQKYLSAISEPYVYVLCCGCISWCWTPHSSCGFLWCFGRSFWDGNCGSNDL